MKKSIKLTRGRPLRTLKWVSRAALVAALAACGSSAGEPSFGNRQDNLLAEGDLAADAVETDLFAEAPAPAAGTASQKCKKSEGDDGVSDGESDGDESESDDDDVSDGDDTESDSDDVSDGDDTDSDGDDVSDGDDTDSDGDDVSDGESDGDDVSDGESDGDDVSDGESDGDDVSDGESDGEDDCIPVPAEPAPDLEIQ